MGLGSYFLVIRVPMERLDRRIIQSCYADNQHSPNVIHTESGSGTER